MNSNTIHNCGVSDEGTNIQTISDNPYSHVTNKQIIIEAYTLFEGWKLYEDELSWTEWIISYFYNTSIERPLTKYIFNLETGEVFSRSHLIDYELVKVGQFGQETKDPYIYMEDSSYIRILPKYNSLIQNSHIAKKCQQKYIDNLNDDV